MFFLLSNINKYTRVMNNDNKVTNNVIIYAISKNL